MVYEANAEGSAYVSVKDLGLGAGSYVATAYDAARQELLFLAPTTRNLYYWKRGSAAATQVATAAQIGAGTTVSNAAYYSNAFWFVDEAAAVTTSQKLVKVPLTYDASGKPTAGAPQTWTLTFSSDIPDSFGERGLRGAAGQHRVLPNPGHAAQRLLPTPSLPPPPLRAHADARTSLPRPASLPLTRRYRHQQLGHDLLQHHPVRHGGLFLQPARRLPRRPGVFGQRPPGHLDHCRAAPDLDGVRRHDPLGPALRHVRVVHGQHRHGRRHQGEGGGACLEAGAWERTRLTLARRRARIGRQPLTAVNPAAAPANAAIRRRRHQLPARPGRRRLHVRGLGVIN